jgi:DNA invertase Pin-like site-specific DNA recombinase
MSRCAVYTRADGAGSLADLRSIEEQRALCLELARVNADAGWSVVPERFDDRGRVAAGVIPPALARLIAAVEEGRVGIVLAARFDRLGGSLLDAARVVDRLEAAGAAFFEADRVRIASQGAGVRLRVHARLLLHVPEKS